jgi:hypothetical protein
MEGLFFGVMGQEKTRNLRQEGFKNAKTPLLRSIKCPRRATDGETRRDVAMPDK